MQLPLLAAIFDLDGVLTDTTRLHERAWREALDPFPMTHEDYTKHFDGRKREEGLGRFLTAHGFETNQTWRDHVMERKGAAYDVLLANGVATYPDMELALQWLRMRGVRTAVASSSRKADAVLDAAFLSNLFEVVIGGEQPKPDSFKRAAELMGVPFSECAVFEDSPHAALMAMEAGAKYVVYVRKDR